MHSGTAPVHATYERRSNPGSHAHSRPCPEPVEGFLASRTPRAFCRKAPGLRGTSNPGSADEAVATPTTGLWPGSDAKRTRGTTRPGVATSAGGWRPRTPQPRWGCSVLLTLPQGKRSFLALTLVFAPGPLWGPALSLSKGPLKLASIDRSNSAFNGGSVRMRPNPTAFAVFDSMRVASAITPRNYARGMPPNNS